MASLNPEVARDMSWLVKAAEHMLRPVARLLVGKLSCQVAINLLKEAYIEEAKRRLRLEGKRRITQSALALMTGLDTRAIGQLEAEPAPDSVTSSDLCPEAAVLNSWATNPMFCDSKTGKPLLLPIYGRGVSFQTLIMRNAGRNVTCPTVLNRLTESGNVELVGDQHVRLLSHHYVPVNSSEQTVIEVGSGSINRLGRTIAHNLEAEQAEPKWLHQERWSRRIPAEKLDALRQRVRELLTDQIEVIEKELDAAEAPVRQNNHRTVGIGWFYWEDSDHKG